MPKSGWLETESVDDSKDNNDKVETFKKAAPKKDKKIGKSIVSSKITMRALVGDDDADEEEEKEQRGKPKSREGRFKIGRQQFLPNAYVFIPQKLLLQPTFNFSTILKDLGLSTPSLIFRMNRALHPSEWNVRLPSSRRHLADAYRILRDTEKKHGSPTKVAQAPRVTLSKAAKKEKSEEDYIRNLRGSIDHYHGVLEENCRRLLRTTYAACIQVIKHLST